MLSKKKKIIKKFKKKVLKKNIFGGSEGIWFELKNITNTHANKNGFIEIHPVDPYSIYYQARTTKILYREDEFLKVINYDNTGNEIRTDYYKWISNKEQNGDGEWRMCKFSEKGYAIEFLGEYYFNFYSPSVIKNFSTNKRVKNFEKKSKRNSAKLLFSGNHIGEKIDGYLNPDKRKMKV